VGVLICFIHHLAHLIQIDTIMSGIERETREVIDDVYPTSPAPRSRSSAAPTAWAVVVPAISSGYIQAVEPDPLVRAATHHDLVIRLARRVGDHVVTGTPIAWAWQRSPDQPPVQAALLQAPLGDAVHVGFERTMLQDVLFGLRRLVDIANRALSPAVNDPYTVIQAVPHLAVLLCSLAPRRLGDRLCYDSKGTCGWRCRSRTLVSTCCAAPPRSDGSAPASRR
jgi:uncharacterized membrane protein